MPNQLVECVPNFSEGRDAAKIAQIVAAVQSVPGIRLLNVDPGWDTNRTVATFVGSPPAVAEAAFRAVEKAAEVIDMRAQHGTHPRIGATDVFPFVPIEGITLAQCAELARQVARRVGEELRIPIYLYEAAAATPQRANLADIRQGEYEGLAEKMKDPRWQPDFGPAEFNPRAGATVMGAREFLIAYNITLNTRDKAAAADIAYELRERGRAARSKTSSPYYCRGELLCYRNDRYPCGNCDFVGKSFAETEQHCRSAHGYELRELIQSAYPSPPRRGPTAGWSGEGTGVRAEDNAAESNDLIGQKVRRAGKFKFCKAIGWYAEQFRRAQISINLTSFRQTPPHLVLEEARKLAAERGLVVTGSEIVGMIPYAALLAAGTYYLAKQGAATDIPPLEILETAVFSMGLSDVQPFAIAAKVIGLPPKIAAHLLRAKISLTEMTIHSFVDATARATPTPGGGCVAALAGSLGAALAAMAAKIAEHKPTAGREKQAILARIAERAQTAHETLLQAVEDDAEAFRAYLDARRLPAKTADEQELRARQVETTLRQAIEVPYRTALTAFEAMQLAHEMAVQGAPVALTDAAVGCEIAFAAVRGSLWNVAANLEQIDDSDHTHKMRDQCADLLENARKLNQENGMLIDETLALH